MPFTRLATGTLGAALLGLTPVAVAPPGHATEDLTTTTVAEPSATEAVFGEDISVSVDIDASNGSPPNNGTSTLYAAEAGATAWVPVATSANVYATFYDVKPRMTTTYKVVYSGHTATTTSENTYTPSESAPFTVRVARRITLPADGFVLKGRVTPDYARKKVVVRASRKIDRGFTAFTTIRTDRRGRYRVVLPKRQGRWYWLVSVRADARFVPTSYVWETYIS